MTDTYTPRQFTPEDWDPEDETARDVLGLIRMALGWDPEDDTDGPTFADVPSDSLYIARRDIEYIAEDPYGTGIHNPDYAAPYGADGHKGSGWDRSTIDVDSDDPQPEESDWSGSDQLVYWTRWDWYGVTLPELMGLAYHNLWTPDAAEPLAGYLHVDGLHPAVSMVSDGMDWNQGGWTPVYIGVDYLVLD